MKVKKPTTAGAPPRVVGHFDCGDGWGASRLLLAMAIEDSLTDGAAKLAAELRAVAPTDQAFALALHAYVLAHVRFERESVEEFESGGYTLELGSGDCDAHFRLVYGVATAGGLRAGLGLLHHGDGEGPAHAVAVLWLDGRWQWAETTVAARFDEPPNDAARRLGLTTDRSDIAKEVRIMTEKDLAPIPPGFRTRNSPAQVALDAEALARLGFLDPSFATLADPTATPLRLGVRAFQAEKGLVADGLLGPTTRLAIAAALRAAGAPVTSGFNYPGIGGLDAAPASVAPVLTKHLSARFFPLVHAMCERFRAGGAAISDLDMLRVWKAESGVKNIPNAQGYPYGGLNQMGPQERRSAGFQGTFADWLALDCADQLPYVERFYVSATGGRFKLMRDAGSLYLINFLPAYVGHAAEPDFVLARRDPAGPLPTDGEDKWKPWREAHKGDWYAANRGFDRRKDGTIRVGDMKSATDATASGPYWAELAARMVAEASAPLPMSAKGIGGIGMIVAMLAAGGWAAWNAATS